MSVSHSSSSHAHTNRVGCVKERRKGKQQESVKSYKTQVIRLVSRNRRKSEICSLFLALKKKE